LKLEPDLDPDLDPEPEKVSEHGPRRLGLFKVLLLKLRYGIIPES